MRVAVKVVIFTVRDATLKVLLIRRAVQPFEGRMSVPGSFVRGEESLRQAALRRLRETTGPGQVYLEQLYSFDDHRRDSRGRVVSVAYYALIPGDRRLPAAPKRQRGQPGRAGAQALWPVNSLPALAFDHRKIVQCAVERLRNKLEYTTVGFQLLPVTFTLPELQAVYEAVLGKSLDKRNFRKKMDLLGILKPLNQWRRTGRKPARLYRFSAGKFEKLKDKGILFPF